MNKARKKAAKPRLLTGGNPQIAKADGDAPVQEYIAAMPGWKREVGRHIDALIVRTVPNVRKAVRWNTPFYGVEGQGWFLGFPRSFLARSNADSDRWRADFVRTFLERDVPQLGISIPATTLERFWAMLAHYHGQTWNASELARSFGVSHHVTRRYLEALEATYMVRVLRPYFANIGKRQVKSPKVYLRDSGVLHHFLGVDSKQSLERHPKLGASWEGFLLEAVIHQLGARDRQCYYWATHTGAELDLLVESGGKRRGFEFKRTTAPRITKSMRSALESLDLTRIDVIHAGDKTYPLSRRVRAVAATRLLDDLKA